MRYESSSTHTPSGESFGFIDGTSVISQGTASGPGNDSLQDQLHGTQSTIDAQYRATSLGERRYDSSSRIHGKLDTSLLKRASELLSSLQENSDPVINEVDFQSLRCVVLTLWETATNASEFHQEILAMLESAILSIDLPGEEHLLVFREAVADLDADPLTPVHVDVLRSRFIKRGFNPLALLGNLDDCDE